MIKEKFLKRILGICSIYFSQSQGRGKERNWESEASTLYYEVMKMSHDEKMEMYMKLDKKEVVEMLIQANNVLDQIKPKAVFIKPIPNKLCIRYIRDSLSSKGECIYCGRPERAHNKLDEHGDLIVCPTFQPNNKSASTADKCANCGKPPYMH